MTEEKEKIILEAELNYTLSDKDGKEIESGKAQGKISEESFFLLPELGHSLFSPLRDIVKINAADYKISIQLISDDIIILSQMGYKYEDFLRVLSRVRNEILLKDMLINEPIKKTGIFAEYVYLDSKNKVDQEDKCELRLYETALTILPEKNEIFQIPFSSISHIKEEDHKISFLLESGEKLFITKLGYQFDVVKKVISDSMNELTSKVQSHLKELLPEIDPITIRKASLLMKEGKVAKREDLESISPKLWALLETKVTETNIKEQYEYLKSLSQQEKICIGLKRGLMDELTGDYIWFLIPIYNSEKLGNAVAMESISDDSGEGGGGKATYFFRMVSRKDFPNLKNVKDLDKELEVFIKNINRCMIAINFRREPVYLPKQKLEDSQYIRYKFAIKKIPELLILRNLFIGRVIHSSFEQWKKDVNSLLEFNFNSKDDNIRWQKN